MTDEGLAPQGGDPRHRPPEVEVDLSTCVSRYGPPPAAVDALRNLPVEVLHDHPYGADGALLDAYARYLDVPALELVAGRGASGLIWQLAASPLGRRVAVPLPAYTEYRQAFPAAGAGPPGVHHSLDLVERLLSSGRVVLVANPHNPSGRAHTAAELTALATARAAVAAGGVLVVDESYVEFTADPSAFSLVGGPADNVVVLRSPSKFFGLAGARVGVAWSRRADLRAAFAGRGGAWPVSALEVRPVLTALAADEWAHQSHRAVRDDARWLDGALRARGPSIGLVAGSAAHFRLLLRPDATRVRDALAAAGVGVRVLGAGHGLPGGAVRITAPRADERARVLEALDRLPCRPDTPPGALPGRPAPSAGP